MYRNLIGTSIEILEILGKAHSATVLKLGSEALISNDAAIEDLARQVTKLALPSGTQVTRILLHSNESEASEKIEIDTLVALEERLVRWWPEADRPIITCTESAGRTDKKAEVYILLISEKQQQPPMSVSEKILLHNEISASLNELWQQDNYRGWSESGLDWVKHPPLYPTSVTTEGILVLGINPSLNEEHLSITHYEAKLDEGSDYFGRLAKFMKKVEYEEQRIHNAANTEATAAFAAVPWSHLDVLYVRETKQVRFRQEMGREGVADFIYEQTQITRRLIEIAKPRLILVANSFARELLGKDVNSNGSQGVWMGLEFTQEQDLRTGTYHCTSLPGSPPVFFTGSFAGSNPRDKGGDERLALQMARCLYLQ